MTESMFELADELKALREEKAEAEEALKQINAKIADTDERLSSLMLDTETQNFTRSGTMFSLRTPNPRLGEGGPEGRAFRRAARRGLRGPDHRAGEREFALGLCEGTDHRERRRAPRLA